MVIFMQIPIVIGQGLAPAPGEVVKDTEDKQVTAEIDPDRIEAITPGFYWGSFIYMQSGRVFCTMLTVEEVTKIILTHYETVTSHIKVVAGKKNLIHKL